MAKIFTPTHREGCEIAARFLHKNMNCGAVFIEPNPTTNSESPDAIGFRPDNCSVLMEVKVSRGDFLSDRKKPHRMDPALGMGDWRFYVCPEGVIKVEDLPAKWGLFYFTPRKSLKPIHVPHVQISSLYSVRHYLNYVTRHNAECPNTPLPPYVKHIVDMVEKFGHVEKNTVAEANIMYGAWRQLCIAQSSGVPYTVSEVFQRPELR